MLVFFLLLILFCGLMPIGAITCFHLAWNARRESPERALVKILLLFPATVYPILMLTLTTSGHPVWKMFGESDFRYMATGKPAGPFFPLFTISNGIVALAIGGKHFTRSSVLTALSLLTCLMTCLFFAIGNTYRGEACLIQFSMSFGYAYGLFLVMQSDEVLKTLPRHYPLLIGWLASVVLTVVSSFVRSREMIADLPDEPPSAECFIVTAAARGHQTIVRSSVDSRTGRPTNSQLASFRAVEAAMINCTPRIHRVARMVYNSIGPTIARSIIFRWQADLVYLLLKPLEWLVRCFC